ncbi:LysM peptidoglycan-binding domain-containing protein [Sutcliffiella deserti]|uniref:LysM peptidoglycan-binding domain-containing protein n=1 Tax=Sutcliffiella deserti TaxID=2875501 RepID=UPI001CBEFD34|nr:LysM peptidoglycan-binding domain-containing protein [Sutcliffiella deserti]
MNNHDQADSLREKVEKATSETLPSRSEIHAEKRKNTKWKIKFPIVRLLGIAFILIPISILAIHYNSEDTSILKSLLPTSGKVESYEQISISTKKPTKPDSTVEEEESLSLENTDSNAKATETSINTDTGATKESEVANNDASDGNKDAESEEEKVINKEKVEENVEYIEHIVATGETLYRISMNYYNSRSGEKIISDYNNLINNQVNTGQKLIIPVKKE